MIRPQIWDANVQTAFDAIIYDGGQLWKSVQLGEAELWRVDEHDCSGFLATQVYGDMLFVHCFAGRRSVALMRRLALLAKANGLKTVGFFSMHAAAKRALGRFAETRETGIPGETEFHFDVELLCALPKTLADPSRFA